MTTAIHLAQTCEHCGKVFWPSKHGRTPSYCSNRCKQAAYRRRKLMQRFEDASTWLRLTLQASAHNEIRNMAERPTEKEKGA